MEIRIGNESYPAITYSGEVSEEGRNWDFCLTIFHSKMKIIWKEDAPPNHEEVENDIKNQFNIWNR